MENIKIHSSSNVCSFSKLYGNVKIGKNCIVTNSTLKNCEIADNVIIENSHIEESVIKDNVKIGPYARLRPFCVIQKDAQIGNFVEIKNSEIGERSKVPHHSYVGDCKIGKDVNIGCGVVFCNYDGFNKHKTVVGNKVFIGSNSNIISPCCIEDNAFIAAGTTLTCNVYKNEFCISRAETFKKKYSNNLYLKNFTSPLKYFGTDGIRGVYGEDLTDELATKVGSALCTKTRNAKVLIGIDPRPSSENLQKALALGISSCGGEVYTANVVPTAAVAYLSKLLGFDYGVMITASHNEEKYNGIKIFSKKGYKLSYNEEAEIENFLKMPKVLVEKKYKKCETDAYMHFLESITKNKFDNLKIYFDCANGSVVSTLKQYFKNKNAKVIFDNTSGEINKNAGILCEKIFLEKLKKSGADIGFCFDGDGDRCMCATKNLKLLCGDKILYLLASKFKASYVVGTHLTNTAIEKELAKKNVQLIRCDVGDKNIAQQMKKHAYRFGAEKSGHILMFDYATTGDGILTAICLLDIFVKSKKYFDAAENLTLNPCCNVDILCKNKSVLKHKNVQKQIKLQSDILKKNGKIIARASGTEPKLRITVEAKTETLAKNICEKIKDEILKQL